MVLAEYEELEFRTSSGLAPPAGLSMKPSIAIPCSFLHDADEE